MAKDKSDKSTAPLPLAKRGRPTIMKSGAMTPAERKAAERARRAAAGEIQAWITREELEIVEALRQDKGKFTYYE